MELEKQNTPPEHRYPQQSEESVIEANTLWDALVASGIPLTLEDIGKIDVAGPSRFVLFDLPEDERTSVSTTNIRGCLNFSRRRGYSVTITTSKSSRDQDEFLITEGNIEELNIRALD